MNRNALYDMMSSMNVNFAQPTQNQMTQPWQQPQTVNTAAKGPWQAQFSTEGLKGNMPSFGQPQGGMFDALRNGIGFNWSPGDHTMQPHNNFLMQLLQHFRGGIGG